MQTSVSKSLGESAARHQKQQAHAGATGQPGNMQQKAASLVDIHKLATQVAASLQLMPPDARKRELERIRRQTPQLSVLIGDQLRRDNLGRSGELALDVTNRSMAPAA